MDREKRLQWIWRFLQRVAGGPLRRFFNYECTPAAPGVEPYLVVANHNMDLDPALLALSFPQKRLCFLASEHVFRKGLPSRLLQFCFDPISRMKGGTDASASMAAIRLLRRGVSVCLFAEGNRSFNGVTGPIFPATGKLARASGAALITYKIEGGYLTSPRWSRTLRKGRARGYCVNVYTSEQLRQMTPEQINEKIARDLFEDAFARQSEDPCDYVGKRLAEGLERALYICPKCGGIGVLRSERDRFFCDCGLTLRYSAKGFFEGDGEDAPFSTVRDWDAWQDARMRALADAVGEEPPFTDEDVRLIHIDRQHRARQAAFGRLAVSRSALCVGERSFPLNEISDMALVGAAAIVFAVGAEHYEIRARAPSFCARKYCTLYQMMKK